MGTGIEKYTMVIKNCGKRETIEGIEATSQEKIRPLEEKEDYQYLRILEA